MGKGGKVSPASVAYFRLLDRAQRLVREGIEPWRSSRAPGPGLSSADLPGLAEMEADYQLLDEEHRNRFEAIVDGLKSGFWAGLVYAHAHPGETTVGVHGRGELDPTDATERVRLELAPLAPLPPGEWG